MSIDYQIIDKKEDSCGIHLIVKNKENNCLHIEGHSLDKRELPKKALLRETPFYFFPVDQEYVDSELKKS